MKKLLLCVLFAWPVGSHAGGIIGHDRPEYAQTKDVDVTPTPKAKDALPRADKLCTKMSPCYGDRRAKKRLTHRNR